MEANCCGRFVYSGVHIYFDGTIFMANTSGTKHRDTPVRLRRATWLCSEIQLGSGGLKPPDLERALLRVNPTDVNRNVGRKWRRWEDGHTGMRDVDFHKIAQAAIKLGWLDEKRAAEAGFSAKFAGQATRSAGEASELHKEKLKEVQDFKDAKDRLLAALDHFTTTCSSLKHAYPVDAGENDFQLLEEEQDSLDEHDRELLRNLRQETVFTPLPDPQMLHAQLARLELIFPHTGQSPQSRPPALHKMSRRQQAVWTRAVLADLLPTDLVRDDELAATRNGAAFAKLAEMSEKRRRQACRRRLKHLESLAAMQTRAW